MDTDIQDFQLSEVIFVHQFKQSTWSANFRVVVQGQECVTEVVSERIYSSSPRSGALNNARGTKVDLIGFFDLRCLVRSHDKDPKS